MYSLDYQRVTDMAFFAEDVHLLARYYLYLHVSSFIL